MQQRVLVLGGYGLIGTEVARALMARGHVVSALGRNRRAAKAALPNATWHFHDLAELVSVGDWREILRDVDCVVNCAGALQPSANDDLEVVHHHAIAACAEACAAAGVGLVQVSAVGASLEASIAFLRSKAEGDAAVVASGARHWIIRPGLVLAPSAYGGTLLLRMLAAVPVVQPIAMGKAQIQTVSVFDLAGAVAKCIEGEIASGAQFDLVEAEPQSLKAVVGAVRRWLGFTPARVHFPAPKFAVSMVARVADGLGRLGWRSPLRSTAVAVLADGVRGDPEQWAALGQAPVSTLDETLATMSARPEDRQFARLAVLMPLAVLVLSVFWIASGIVGLVRLSDAAQVLQGVGWSKSAALFSVAGWSVVDIALGIWVLQRRYARRACLGMILVSLVYLVSASVLTPALWLDPLGPLVKIFPTIMLAALVRSLLGTR